MHLSSRASSFRDLPRSLSRMDTFSDRTFSVESHEVLYKKVEIELCANVDKYKTANLQSSVSSFRDANEQVDKKQHA